MSNQFNIDDLFSKAATQPVVASFGETKELFLTTVSTGSYTSKSNTSRIFTLKNGLIMLAIVSIIVTAILWTGNPAKEKVKVTEVTPTEKVIPNEQAPQTPEKKHQQVVIPPMHSNELLTSVVEFIEQTDWMVTDEVFFADNLPDKMPPPEFKFDPGQIDFSRPYEFPVLTKEQIQANNKRKKKMVKQIVKMDKRYYAYVPSGSFTYHDAPISVQAFHMQTTEVSNIQYKTFLFDLLIHGRKEDFLKAKPDQTMWTKIGGDMKAMQDNYFSNEAYDDYPVVNVSRKGAEMYCVWLTKEVNKVKKAKGDPMINDVRLPVRPEWEMAASGTGKHMPFPWGGPLAQNAKGCFLANYDPSLEGKLMDTNECDGCDTTNLIYSDGAMLTAKTKTYNPNTYGLYNMSGNVAEMVYGRYTKVDSTIVRGPSGTAGGGWMSPFESIKINGKDEHAGLTTAHPNVGFRVVMTYLRPKKD